MSYPNNLDNIISNKSDSTPTKIDHAQHHNDLANAVNKIETELGLNPRGASSDVATRITTIESGSRVFAAAALPTGLGWTGVNLGTVVYQDILGTDRSVAQLGVTAHSLFDQFSTAYSNPMGGHWFADPSGNDANSGASGSKWRSAWKAVEAANALGAGTYLLELGAGDYDRIHNFWFGTGGVGVVPNAGVEIAVVCPSGRARLGTYDFPVGTPTRDATFTQCFTWTLANADRIVDTANLNIFGHYSEPRFVATPTICNQTPDSWTISAGTIYYNRADGVTPSSTNTRVYRINTMNVYLPNVSNYFFENIDFEGSDTVAALHSTIAGGASGFHALITNNCTIRYASGAAATGGAAGARCVSVDSFPGIEAHFNGDVGAAATDGFNKHNTNGNPNQYRLLVNCTGSDFGRSGNQSNNAVTSHEDAISIDYCGNYRTSRGGGCYSINMSKSLFGRTTMRDDFGDRCFGGAIDPVLFRIDNTGVFYCDRTRAIGPAGTIAYFANGGTIHQNQIEPTGLASRGANIDTNWP